MAALYCNGHADHGGDTMTINAVAAALALDELRVAKPVSDDEHRSLMRAIDHDE